MAIIKPIRASMTTNMQVVQTSILLKYRSLFSFLQNHVPNVASEIQRTYIGAARAYYETGFRRYCRSLGWIMVSEGVRSDNQKPYHLPRQGLWKNQKAWSTRNQPRRSTYLVWTLLGLKDLAWLLVTWGMTRPTYVFVVES